MERAPAVWRAVRQQFAAVAPPGWLDAPEIAALADRVVTNAAYVSRALAHEAQAHDGAWRTLVHGDFKSANLFFHVADAGVTAFDWQWSGAGLGALDVAYLLNTSVAMAALGDGDGDETGELALLRVYHDQLMRKAAQTSGDWYPFDTFRRHYALALLDYARVLLGCFWADLTPAKCAAKWSNANCGLGYRSVPHLLRLVRRVDQSLRLVEHERRQQAAAQEEEEEAGL